MGRAELVQELRDKLVALEAGGDPTEFTASVRLLAHQHMGPATPTHRDDGTARNGLVLDICKAVNRFCSGDPNMNALALRAYLWNVRAGNPHMMRLPLQMLDAIDQVLRPNSTPDDLRPFTRPPKLSARSAEPPEPIIEGKAVGMF